MSAATGVAVDTLGQRAVSDLLAAIAIISWLSVPAALSCVYVVL